MKIKKELLLFFPWVVIFALAFYIYILKEENTQLRESLPSLCTGDRIDYFMLTGTDGSAVDTRDIDTDDGKTFIIFIFESPCSSCNKSIPVWNKITSEAGNNSRVFGIISEGREKAAEFSESGVAKFNLFTPLDRQDFLKRLNIRINLPQTIVYRNGKIIFIRLGELQLDDYLQIKKIISPGI